MPVIFPCPACGRELEAPETMLGAEGVCRFCGAHITAPGGASEPGTTNAEQPQFNPVISQYRQVSEPTGRIEAGAIVSETWTYLKQYWTTLLAATLIINALFMVVLLPVFVAQIMLTPGGFGGMANDTAGEPPMWIVGVILLVELLAYPMMAGPLYVADRIIAWGDASLGAVFGWVRHYKALLAFFVLLALSMLPMGLLVALLFPLEKYADVLIWPVLLLSFIYYGFVLVSLGLGIMEIVDRGSDAVSALKASWEFTKGHRWAILGAGMLLYLVAMSGVLACYIGVLFTTNALPLGTVLLYRHLRGLQGGE